MTPVFISTKAHVLAELSLFLTISGYVILFIIAIVMHKTRQPTSFLIESGIGKSGWNDGIAWLLSISNAMYAYGGIDGGMSVPRCNDLE